MRRVTLNPLLHRDEYTALVERELLAYLKDTIFDPLFDLLAPVRHNEKSKDEQHSAVWDALLAGAIWYAHGVFSGAFDAAISKELRAMGARKVPSGFALAQSEIPIPLRGAVAISAMRAQDLHRAMLKTLDAMLEHIEDAPTGLVFTNTVDTITDDLQEQFVSSVEGLLEPTPVPPGFAEELREKIAVDTDRSIKGFSVEQVEQLRDKVQANLEGGARTDRLAKIVEVEFGVSKRRARGIAEHETSLLVSKFRQRRLQDIGVEEYDWDTSHDEKVRADHSALDGKRFSWSSPPITNRATGARNHPGEDHNCRCVPRGVLIVK